MRAIGLAASLAALSALPAFTQPPSFEVASVKPSAMNSGPPGMGFFTYPGGRVLCNMCKLDYLVQLACDLQPFQVTGGPRWIHEDRFDLEARPPASSESSHANPSSVKTPPDAEQRLMLQTLLADRFQLKYHRETKEGAIYFLMKGNRELKLEDAHDKTAYSWVGGMRGGAIMGDGLWGTNASMQLLASRLSPYLEHPVLDRTGIAGSFDFKVAYSTDDPHADLTDSIVASVLELGLKLQPGRGPVETLVIDSVAKPAAN